MNRYEAPPLCEHCAHWQPTQPGRGTCRLLVIGSDGAIDKVDLSEPGTHHQRLRTPSWYGCVEGQRKPKSFDVTDHHPHLEQYAGAWQAGREAEHSLALEATQTQQAQLDELAQRVQRLETTMREHEEVFDAERRRREKMREALR